MSNPPSLEADIQQLFRALALEIPSDFKHINEEAPCVRRFDMAQFDYLVEFLEYFVETYAMHGEFRRQVQMNLHQLTNVLYVGHLKIFN